MRKIFPLAVLMLLVTGCSGMGGMHTSGDSGEYGRASGYESNWNSTTYPVINPRTGHLTFYHGG